MSTLEHHYALTIPRATVLEGREAQRVDGIEPGTAPRHAAERERWEMPYDLVLDAILLSPVEMAQRVVEWLEPRPTPRAMGQMARSAP